MSDPDEDVLRRLESLFATRDADELDRVLPEAWALRVSVRWAPIFARLLGERWHAQQQELADSLQDMREPSTIEALYAVAHDAAPYNEVDDGRALARKCVWALHDIGTPAAIARLHQLAAAAGDLETRGHAAKRLAALAARAPDAPPEPYRIARDRNVRR